MIRRILPIQVCVFLAVAAAGNLIAATHCRSNFVADCCMAMAPLDGEKSMDRMNNNMPMDDGCDSSKSAAQSPAISGGNGSSNVDSGCCECVALATPVAELPSAPASSSIVKLHIAGLQVPPVEFGSRQINPQNTEFPKKYPHSPPIPIYLVAGTLRI